MHDYIFRVLDSFGVMVMGNGYGDYIQAPNAADAKRQAEAIFLAPDPEPSNALEAKFLASIGATRRRIIANGYTIEVKRRR
jgi:hypothetical protein